MTIDAPPQETAPATAKPKSVSIVRIIALFLIVVGGLAAFGWYRLQKAAPPTGSVVDQMTRTNYRRFTATVAANKEWQVFAEAVVRTGERVVVGATGQWKVGPSHDATGPEGKDATGGLMDWRVMKEAKLGQLLGGVGPDPKMAYGITADPAGFTAPNDGPLAFRINDSDPSNNSGDMTLTIDIYEP